MKRLIFALLLVCWLATYSHACHGVGVTTYAPHYAPVTFAVPVGYAPPPAAPQYAPAPCSCGTAPATPPTTYAPAAPVSYAPALAPVGYAPSVGLSVGYGVGYVNRGVYHVGATVVRQRVFVQRGVVTPVVVRNVVRRDVVVQRQVVRQRTPVRTVVRASARVLTAPVRIPVRAGARVLRGPVRAPAAVDVRAPGVRVRVR